MRTTVKKLEPTKVQLTITVDKDDLNPFLNKTRNDIAKRVNVPGFRKGHVPARVVDARFGYATVVSESLNDAVPAFYGKAMDAKKLHAMNQPQFDVKDIPSSAEDNTKLKFTAAVEIRPEFTLPDPSTLTISVPNSDVTEEDITKHLEDLRHRFGSLVGVDRPAKKGDFVSIDLTAKIDGKDVDSQSGVSYEIGSGTMLDGMDEALEGLSAGEKTTFEAPLSAGKHKGEKAIIEVTANSVKQEELPELDDDFAQEASEFATLDELKDSIRKQSLLDAAARQADEARDAFIARLEEGLDIPVPKDALELAAKEQLNRMVPNTDKASDDDKKKAKEIAEKDLRDQMVLDNLTEALDIVVNQSDVYEFLAAVAQQYGLDPSQFINAIIRNRQLESAVSEVARQKGMIAGMRQAKFLDADGEPVNLSQFLGKDEEEAKKDDSVQAASEAAAAADKITKEGVKKTATKKAAKSAAAKSTE